MRSLLNDYMNFELHAVNKEKQFLQRKHKIRILIFKE